MCKVSVVMPVYNSEKYLAKAIDSILQQSFKDFEFLIFNDGSTDSSAAIIKSYTDHRIKFFDYPQNSGYVTHLNQGIQLAKGEYVARMDSDDISASDRFEKQVFLLDANPEVGICGSWYDIIDVPTDIVTIPTKHEELLINLTLNSVFGHPSVMIRKSVLKEHHIVYNEQYMPAEDFFMWVELSRVTKLANIGEVLLHYRRHSGQISQYKQQYQLGKIQEVRELQVEHLLDTRLTPKEQQIAVFLFGTPDGNYAPGFFNDVLSFANRLLHKNKKKAFYPGAAFERFLFSRIQTYFSNPLYRATLKPNMPLLFNGGNRIVLEELSLTDRIKFYVKCLIKWPSF